MMRKYHVRFGGGRLEKESQGHLVSRLPYKELCQAEGPDDLHPNLPPPGSLASRDLERT
jgi:hypothetical protein